MKSLRGATPNALLGLLSLGPMSGYDMRQMISRSIGYFWSESYGQIYPALKRLLAEGLIEKDVERKKGRPDRMVYSLTASGKRQLREWLKISPSTEVPRNELLLKLFGVYQRPGACRAHVEAFLRQQQQALKEYAAIEKKMKLDSPNALELPYWAMTLSYGQHHSAALVKWAEATLKRLNELEKK